MKNFRKYLIAFWFSFFIMVCMMGATRHILLNGTRIKGTPKDVTIFLSTILSNFYNYIEHPKPMIIANNTSLNNDSNFSQSNKGGNDYLLIGSWDNTINQAVVKLLRIKDNKILHKWSPDIKLLNKMFNSTSTYGVNNSLTKTTTRLRHPFLLSDGSLIFSAGGIYKVDRNSIIIWSNNTNCHHSIEQDLDGNFWTCSYNSSTKNSEKFQISDDVIGKISGVNGEILFEKSVFEILMENGYDRGVFFINPQVSDGLTYLDYSHLNDVQPVLEDSRFWKKGDLFLSLRHQNLVLLYRPSINKVIWSQNGPWVRQHDVTIIDSTRIGIFGNNVLDAAFPNENDRFIDGNNREYVYDFATNEVSTPYYEFFKSSKIRTYTEGRARIFPNGEIFVEETNKGRLLYGNQKEEIWSYIEKIGEDKVSMFNWCRYITEDKFKKLTFVSQNNN